MKISYGKNVYGDEEIIAVVNQLKKTTQMGNSVKKFEKLIFTPCVVFRDRNPL